MWAAAIVLPPAGLILLWMRPARIVFKILGTLAIAILGVAHLFLFWGMQVELDGSGMRPIFSFSSKEDRFARLEESRRQPEAATAPGTTAPAAESAVPEATPPATPALTGYWTDFRGPGRKGHYDESPIRLEWPAAGLPRHWRQPVGGGYASFVIAGGRAFTIEQRRAREVVAAYDLATGRELWTDSWEAAFSESMGGDGPRATPVLDGDRLYALGAEGELRVLDARGGKLLWRKNILEDNGATNLQWGMSCSPLIVDDKVIVLPGGGGGKSVVAYHKLTGERVWSALDDRQAYTSPMLVTLAGRRQILTVSATRAAGLGVEKGDLLWEYPWTTQFDVNSSQPIVVGGNRFLISAGYGHGSALVGIAPAGERFAAREIWSNNRLKCRFNSPVLHEGHVYGLDEGILACIRLDDGQLKWKGGRYGYGQLLLAGAHLVVLAESGEVALVKAAPDRHEELARFAAIAGKTWNHPAISGGVLLVRNAAEMAAYRIAP
jgi:outer membrane protein assembly factor BamB